MRIESQKENFFCATEKKLDTIRLILAKRSKYGYYPANV